MTRHILSVIKDNIIIDTVICADLITIAHMAKHYSRKYRFADGYKIEHDKSTSCPAIIISLPKIITQHLAPLTIAFLIASILLVAGMQAIGRL